MTPAPTPPPPTQKKARRVVVRGVSWDAYEKLLEGFAETPSVRLTYDRGVLEIMVISLGHDNTARILFMIVSGLGKGFGIDLHPGGATTMKRKVGLAGGESDEIFWIANEAVMRGVTDLDLTIHPPPDLAVEVDVSRSSTRRLRVLATVGVPEIWRLRGDSLTFLGLVGKQYVEIERSRSFPLVGSADVLAFIQRTRSGGIKFIDLAGEVVEWARARAVGGSTGDQSAGG